MEELITMFESVPLPYSYVEIPKPNDPENKNDIPLFFYVNKVVSNLTIQAFKHSGFDRTENDRVWNASWGRQYQSNKYRAAESWQKVNHFAGAYLLGRKDNLHKRMKELRDKGLGEFYPRSFLLPGEKEELESVWKTEKRWIVKPCASSRCKSIYLLTSDQEIPEIEGIVQTYIERPRLVIKKKFDIRLYILVTSIDPVRIYTHRSGFARLSDHEYDYSTRNLDPGVHITNIEHDQDDEDAQSDSDRNKWTLEF